MRRAQGEQVFVVLEIELNLRMLFFAINSYKVKIVNSSTGGRMTRDRTQPSKTMLVPEAAVKMMARDAPGPDERQREAAEYISEMILELRNLARTARLYHVMVPLEYAYYEAFSVANWIEIPEAEIERIKLLSRAGGDSGGQPVS